MHLLPEVKKLIEDYRKDYGGYVLRFHQWSPDKPKHGNAVEAIFVGTIPGEERRMLITKLFPDDFNLVSWPGKTYATEEALNFYGGILATVERASEEMYLGHIAGEPKQIIESLKDIVIDR